MTTIYDIGELEDLIERQRVIIDMYDHAVESLYKNRSFYEDKAFGINVDDLCTAYEASQNTHAMTGASEK